MSRFDYADFDYLIPYGLWRGALLKALGGRRGQAALREIERALLAMPVRALVADRIAVPADDDAADESGYGGVCFVGAYAAWQETQKGREWNDVVDELALRYDDDSWETELLGERAGLTRRLAHELAWLNDETWSDATPERRWELALAWVRSKIRPEVSDAENGATQAPAGSGGRPAADPRAADHPQG